MYIEAIKFNHDQGSLTNDAINIRKNASQSISIPEWKRGICINPEDSLAAYSIEDTRNRTITIQVQFRRTDSSMNRIEVRAVDPTLWWYKSGQGCIYWLLTKLGIIVDPGPPTHLNVLGEVRAREIQFNPDGLTDFITFELEGVRLCDRGVGIDDTVWQWQVRTNPDEAWSSVGQVTRHRIYSVLSEPKLPWAQFPIGSTNNPWSEVLDYACRWADGATKADDAACRITEGVFDLGPNIMEYDCISGGSTHYSWGEFDCTEFLELLGGGFGLGRYVNCTDCATIVSTFSNILGCDLWQSRMGYSFGLNPLLAIGSSIWQPACGWSGFSYHEVAWKGDCTEEDRVFDACLKVDGDNDPTSPPHQPVLPCNMRFGNAGDSEYRDRLATPSSRSNCNPQPSTRKRRDIS
ncbi:MAG: hypothetical protein ACFFER_02645 [Candidatus Thorarchaeota archaeon]